MDALPQERVRHCSFVPCVEEALTLCAKCGKWYCLEHASELDPTKYCVDCLKSEDITLEQAPLVDHEGVRHTGKVIRPVGLVFAQNSKLIAEMNDEELKDYIIHYQQAVRDCEKSLAYAQITLGNALFESGHREITKINQRGEVYFPTPKKTTPINKPRKAAKPAMDEDKLIEFLMKNLSPEQLAKFLMKKRS